MNQSKKQGGFQRKRAAESYDIKVPLSAEMLARSRVFTSGTQLSQGTQSW
jgi:hypothetical protein